MNIRPASIIVCTYNRAPLLSGVIKQLCVQNYPKDLYEIIIVDNCSSDDTPQLVQNIIPACGMLLRYVREDSPGVTNARNRGAREARFPYLAYLDDDCSVGPDWLVHLLSGFDLDDKISVVAGRIALDYDDQKIPAWLGPKLERWLGVFNFPGPQSRVLENPGYVCEGNMAISHQAWEAAGGFFGMDQFSSPHMAAQEIIYLLEQVRRRGGKVAFVPGAIANHHTVIPPRKRILMRAYFHGISESMLNYLLNRRSWGSVIYRILLDVAAMFIFLLMWLFFLVRNDRATAMYQLLRAVARFGKIMSNLRLTGDWRRVKLWASTHNWTF